MSMSAIGIFSSTLSNEPMVSGLIQVVISMPFWLLGGFLKGHDSQISSIIKELSFGHHVSLLSSGLIELSSLYYFAALSGFFLFLTVKRYDWTRG